MSRGEPLRRRRRVVDGAGPRRDAERLIDDRPEAFQIASRHRAADAFEIGGNLAPDVATVEIVQPRARKVLKRCGKRGLFEHRTDIGHFVLEEECFLESGCLGHFGQLFCREPRLAAGDDVALASVLDRGRQQNVKRQLAALSLRRVGSEHPGGDRARHGERGERTARRNLVMAGIAIEPRRRLGARASCSHQRTHAARRLADQPEAVAADVIHVRIDRRDAGCHGEHRLDGVAAFGENGAAVLDGSRVRRADDAAAMSGAMQVHSVPAPTSVSPRFFNSASTVGSRPRNAS